MNKTFKSLLAAVLVLVTVLSAVIILPATAAENPVEADAVGETAEAVEPTVYEEAAPGESYTEKIDLAVTGDPSEDPDEDPEEEPVEEAAADPPEAPAEKPSYVSDTVGAITSIKRTGNEATSLELSWNAAEDAEGYHVYWRNTESTKNMVLLSTVKSTSLTIRNLKAGQAFQIKVAGYKTKDGSIIEGKSKTVTAATVPTQVSSFRVGKLDATATTLKWSKVSQCDGYIITRQMDGVWSQLKVLGRDTTEFTDKGLKTGKAYFYNICAYRKDVGGTIKSKTSRVNTVAGLKAPSNNGTKILLRKVYLNWTKVKYADGYDIFYSTDNKEYKPLKTTTATSYVTDRLKEKTTYYFRVYPFRKVGKDAIKVRGLYYSTKYTVTNSAYGKTVPSTYIEVSISQQHLWYYVDGKLYVSTPVVTGNCNSMDTPKGYWAINNKASPCSLVGPGYVSHVQYWMSFIGSGYGIHDASWRSSFGGQIYKGNGSHGCINTPYSAVQKIYRKAKVGTPVIVY